MLFYPLKALLDLREGRCTSAFSVAAIQKGISLPALQRLLDHDPVDHYRDLPQPLARRGGLRVSGEVVMYTPKSLLTPRERKHKESPYAAVLDSFNDRG